MNRVIDSHLASGSLFARLNEPGYFGLHSSGTSPSPVPGEALVHDSAFIRNFLLIRQRDLKVLCGGAAQEARGSEEAERAWGGEGGGGILDGKQGETGRKPWWMDSESITWVSLSQASLPWCQIRSPLYRQHLEKQSRDTEPRKRRRTRRSRSLFPSPIQPEINVAWWQVCESCSLRRDRAHPLTDSRLRACHGYRQHRTIKPSVRSFSLISCRKSYKESVKTGSVGSSWQRKNFDCDQSEDCAGLCKMQNECLFWASNRLKFRLVHIKQ